MNHPSSIRHLLHHLNFLVPRTRYLLHFQVIWAIVQDYIHGQVSKCYVITVPGTSLVLYITQAEALLQHHHRESVVLNVVILKALGSLLGYLLSDFDVSTLLLGLPVGGRGNWFHTLLLFGTHHSIWIDHLPFIMCSAHYSLVQELAQVENLIL